MGGPVDDVETEEITATEAFAILGNETRMEILRALWQSDEPSSFAELRSDVAPDDKGNFNYHLGKLTDHFVKKTDDGYDLRFAGEQIVRAVLTGTITSAPSVRPAETDERCAYCDAPVEMGYTKDVISVRCTDCGGVIGGDFPDGTYMHYQFPPSGLADRTPEAAIDAAHVLYDSKIAPMMKGICPECASGIDISYDICDDHQVGDSKICPNCDSRYEVWALYECEHCRYRRKSVMWFAALNHPAVVSFYYDHGLDEKIPIRKLTSDNAQFVRDVTGTVTDTDPFRFRVTIPIEDDTLVVSMDEELDVLSARRTSDSR
ncbi:winged helix-turn-helix domain-containing protein [Halorussus halophilus]|uniref:winged helix-turn-helix domain-containing protein n=1 Tax=Halorussus halophilus TaxID=2650975 RepID=UPI0013014063|nr:helix-turn-helix domain-containing protein [Halorussus halophilus]